MDIQSHDIIAYMERLRTTEFLETSPSLTEETRPVPVLYNALRRTILPGHADLFPKALTPDIPSPPPVTETPKKERVVDKFFHWYFDRFPPTEREINFYKAAGVKIFKFFVPNNGQLINKIFKTPRLDTQSKEALERRIEQTKYGERMHLTWVPPILAAGIGVSIAFPLLSPLTLLATAAAEVGINGYPIMLQRYNRLMATEKLNALDAKYTIN